MPTLIIDGESYEVDGSKNLMEVCIQLGFEIPYFCWHPALGSVGSCRQCAVKQYQNEEDQRGRIVMSCMTPITEGMIISLKDDSTQAFRDDCIESVMSNHPHDCPVCEKGGECHLQDMTNLSRHTVRYYDGKKRTYRNQQLGPFINHEMNRCITCYRCVRFYQDYAGGTDLQAQGSSSHVYFGRDKDGTLESPFSGNLVEVCPTGVFTDKTYSRHYARKWDLQTAPSICSHCAIGCNTSPGERYGTLRRVVNRYNGAVNGYFLCDRGRFGYDFSNSEQRLRSPLRNVLGRYEPISQKDALEQLKKVAKTGAVVGIGSPRASLEANYALLNLVGKANFFAGVGHAEQQVNNRIFQVLSNPPVEIASLARVKQADAIVIVGEDILNTAPMLALSVRQATKNKGKALAAEARVPEWLAAAVKNIAQEERSPVINLTVASTGIAATNYCDTPPFLAAIATAVAQRIDANAPAVTGLDARQEQLVDSIAGVLTAAQRPLIISGSGCHCVALVDAAANIAQALKNRSEAGAQEVLLSLVVQEANSVGLTALIEDNPRADLDAAVKRCVEDGGSALAAIVLENDLSHRLEPLVNTSFAKAAKQWVAIDCVENKTTIAAELVLPAASVAETEGTFVSSEGRAQRYFAVHPPTQNVLSSWQWLTQASDQLAGAHFDELTAACAQDFPKLEGIVDAAPDAAYRQAGRKVARQPHRYSGRGSMNSHLSVDENQRPEDKGSALTFSMEGLQGNLPNSLQPDRWAPAWNSSESVNQMQQEVGGALKGGDPGTRLFEPKQGSDRSAGNWYGEGADEGGAVFDVNALTEESATAGMVRNYVPVPLYHLFGSEGLSRYALSISERCPAPYVALHSRDAAALALTPGDAVLVALGDTQFSLALQINDSLKPGAVGIPQLVEFQFGSFNQRATLKKSSEPPLQKFTPTQTQKIAIEEIVP